MTATPKSYPQGRFNVKPCKWCNTTFAPQAPSHLYCNQACADRASDESYLRRTYDIGLADYTELLTKQNHKCAVCGGEGFLMRQSHRMKLVVDHDHGTGKVRGLLCHNCNRALGLMHDNTQDLQIMIHYLEAARG